MKDIFKTGKWIEHPSLSSYAAPVFMTRVTCAKAPENAEIYISGLGFYTLFINGKRAGEDLLSPQFSKYDKTVYYNRIDITDLLSTGENTFEVTLGNGWFNESCADSFDFENAAWKHRPMLICEIYSGGELTDASGSHWMCGESRITWNSVRAGENCDFTKGAPDFNASAVISKGPGGVLREQLCPPVRLISVTPPYRIAGNVYDFGKSTCGDVELSVRGRRGDKIEIIYGERLSYDGHIDGTFIKRHPTIERTQTDRLILSGDVDIWRSDFSYKGFRYIEIIGDCTVIKIEARTFYTDFKQAGGFECSDSRLNRLDSAVKNSLRTNFLHIPTDCPHREKNGWTGDAHISCETALFDFDMAAGYTSYLDALTDCQRPDGELPCIAPTSVYGYNFQSGPTWDAALVMIPWQLYMYYGDKKYLEKYYPNMKLYAGYTESISENGICESGLGDFLPYAENEVCPDGFMLSAYVLKILRTLADIAEILGDAEGARLYSKRADYVLSQVRQRYCGKCAPTVSYYATAVYFGISESPEQDAKMLDELIKKRNYFSGDGLFSSVYLLDVLTEYGYFDTALAVVQNEKRPGWLYMLGNGSEALWEHWSGERGSLNHAMRSPVSSWMYRAIAGINCDKAHPGFSRPVIKPYFSDKITSLSAWHKTPHGIIRVSYESGIFRAELPENITAELHMGGKIIEINGSFEAHIK